MAWFSGQLGSVGGADAKCQTAANGSVLTRLGTYSAWIADTTEDSAPALRFTNLDQTGPYILVDQNATIVANDWDDLTAGPSFLRAPINVTDGGALITADVWTWTNVTPAGTRQRDEPNYTCQSWSSESSDDAGVHGDSSATDAAWTGPDDVICGNPRRLYCFEQG